MGPGASGEPRCAWWLLAVCTVLAGLPVAVAGQVEAEVVLEGVVVRDSVPVPGASVVVHRVLTDTAGELGSTVADSAGRFSFRLPSVPDPGGRGEVYFASVRHQGILYFGPAVTTAVQLDSLYTIEVHDTVAAAPGGEPLPLAMRYLVLEPGEEGWRVTDLIQVRNPRHRTFVARDDSVTWRYPIPPAARDVQIGSGDVGPDAARVEAGTLQVRAPLPPGERQFLLQYGVDGPAFDIPLPGATEAVELLVREPAPPLEVAGLEAVESVEMEPGSTYRRYAGAGLEDAVVRVRETEARAPSIGRMGRWAAVVIAVLLAAAALYAFRRPDRSRPEDPSTGKGA